MIPAGAGSGDCATEGAGATEALLESLGAEDGVLPVEELSLMVGVIDGDHERDGVRVRVRVGDSVLTKEGLTLRVIEIDFVTESNIDTAGVGVFNSLCAWTTGPLLAVVDASGLGDCDTAGLPLPVAARRRECPGL